MLFFGLGDLVYKRGAAAGAAPHQFLMVQTWVFMPSVVLYAAATGSLHFVPGVLWGALAGVFILVGFYNFAHSLGSGSISINAPVFRLSFVLTAALAVLFLGEPLTPFKVAGVALALAAAWLLLGAPASPDKGSGTRASLVRVLVATIAVGLGNFINNNGKLKHEMVLGTVKELKEHAALMQKCLILIKARRLHPLILAEEQWARITWL